MNNIQKKTMKKNQNYRSTYRTKKMEGGMFRKKPDTVLNHNIGEALKDWINSKVLDITIDTLPKSLGSLFEDFKDDLKQALTNLRENQSLDNLKFQRQQEIKKEKTKKSFKSIKSIKRKYKLDNNFITILTDVIHTKNDDDKLNMIVINNWLEKIQTIDDLEEDEAKEIKKKAINDEIYDDTDIGFRNIFLSKPEFFNLSEDVKYEFYKHYFNTQKELKEQEFQTPQQDYNLERLNELVLDVFPDSFSKLVEDDLKNAIKKLNDVKFKKKILEYSIENPNYLLIFEKYFEGGAFNTEIENSYFDEYKNFKDEETVSSFDLGKKKLLQNKRNPFIRSDKEYGYYTNFIEDYLNPMIEFDVDMSEIFKKLSSKDGENKLFVFLNAILNLDFTGNGMQRIENANKNPTDPSPELDFKNDTYKNFIGRLLFGFHENKNTKNLTDDQLSYLIHKAVKYGDIYAFKLFLYIYQTRDDKAEIKRKVKEFNEAHSTFFYLTYIKVFKEAVKKNKFTNKFIPKNFYKDIDSRLIALGLNPIISFENPLYNENKSDDKSKGFYDDDVSKGFNDDDVGEGFYDDDDEFDREGYEEVVYDSEYDEGPDVYLDALKNNNKFNKIPSNNQREHAEKFRKFLYPDRTVEELELFVESYLKTIAVSRGGSKNMKKQTNKNRFNSSKKSKLKRKKQLKMR